MAYNASTRASSLGHGQTANSHPSHTSTSNTSLLRPSTNQVPTSVLQTRINAKRLELQNLQALRDLSGQLTTKLETLETKLGSLRDGAQSVALVMANWESVLGVIRMAGMRVPVPKDDGDGEVVKDTNGEDGMTEDAETKKKDDLPVPLVRIPVQPKTEGG